MPKKARGALAQWVPLSFFRCGGKLLPNQSIPLWGKPAHFTRLSGQQRCHVQAQLQIRYFLDPLVSFPPCLTDAERNGRHRLHRTIAKLTGSLSRHEANDGTLPGSSLSGHSMIVVSRNTGSSSEQQNRHILTGPGARLIWICRVPRTKWA